MRRKKLTIDRISFVNQTENHTTLLLMDFKLDYSFNKLFALTFTAKNGFQTVFCREMQKHEKQHSGQHFNTIQPNHKARFEEREWTKQCNKILQNFHLDIEVVTQICKK